MITKEASDWMGIMFYGDDRAQNYLAKEKVLTLHLPVYFYEVYTSLVVRSS